MIALLDRSFADLSALPGNRVQYASSGRVIPFPTKVEQVEEKMEGEGDRQDAVSTASLHGQTDAENTIGGWGVQVGAFTREDEAQNAATHALKQAPTELAGAAVSVTDDGDANATYRARLVNITQNQAESACKKLAAQHSACVSYRVD
jgi:hypothetical protein